MRVSTVDYLISYMHERCYTEIIELRAKLFNMVEEREKKKFVAISYKGKEIKTPYVTRERGYVWSAKYEEEYELIERIQHALESTETESIYFRHYFYAVIKHCCSKEDFLKLLPVVLVNTIPDQFFGKENKLIEDDIDALKKLHSKALDAIYMRLMLDLI